MRGLAPVSLPACPLMHGTGMWLGALMPHLGGGAIVTLTSRSLDADELCATVEADGARLIAIVGDAFAKPMLARARRGDEPGQPYDLSSLQHDRLVGRDVDRRVKQALLDRIASDADRHVGSTEGGMGSQVTMRGLPRARRRSSRAARHEACSPTTAARSSRAQARSGMVAAGGTSRSATTRTREVGGARSGSSTACATRSRRLAHGRGRRHVHPARPRQQCINTGGEKVYPEEVEEAVKLHAAIERLPRGRRARREVRRAVVAVVALVARRRPRRAG